jgi:hypothetical protein
MSGREEKKKDKGSKKKDEGRKLKESIKLKAKSR